MGVHMRSFDKYMNECLHVYAHIHIIVHYKPLIKCLYMY